MSLFFFLLQRKITVGGFVRKKKGKDQEWIQSSTTRGPGYRWESDKFIIRHHKQEPRGQPTNEKNSGLRTQISSAGKMFVMLCFYQITHLTLSPPLTNFAICATCLLIFLGSLSDRGSYCLLL